MNPTFYFLLTLTAVFAAAKGSGRPVLDFFGRNISDGSYYVMPRYYGGNVGGLTLAHRDGNKCPLYVGQENSVFNWGIPIKFSDRKHGFVTESENINIEMDTKDTICNESTYWRITPVLDVVPFSLFIKAGPKPSNGLFQIKQSSVSYTGLLYRIFFCPDGYDCTKVGVFVDQHGVRRLALNSTSMEFRFVKVGESW